MPVSFTPVVATALRSSSEARIQVVTSGPGRSWQAAIAYRSTQFVQQVVEVDDLIDAVRSPRLLAVPECRVRDPDVRRKALGDGVRRKADRRDPTVRELAAEQVRFGPVQHRLNSMHMLICIAT